MTGKRKLDDAELNEDVCPKSQCLNAQYMNTALPLSASQVKPGVTLFWSEIQKTLSEDLRKEYQ
jgi:hypothetical protein